MLTRDEAQARVSRGAAHLDVVRPGWHNQIDDGKLTMQCGGQCIAGQLSTAYGNFGNDCESLGFSEAQAPSYGMDLTPCEWKDAEGLTGLAWAEVWRPLADAWIEAIADRRLSQGQATAPVIDAVDPAVRQPIGVATRA